MRLVTYKNTGFVPSEGYSFGQSPAKSLKTLLKKYPSILNDIDGLKDILQANPQSGTPLGRDCYKIRIAVASKGAGKSGGARVITYVRLTAGQIIFLDIYDKSEQDRITDKQLKELLKSIQV